MRVLSTVQSNYIPWKGYFDLIGKSDVFVFYDNVQYSKNSWRNRNRIKTAQGPKWLTIPVTVSSLSQKIMDTLIADKGWADKHWSQLEASYGDAPYFADIAAWLKPLYETVRTHDLLWQVNHAMTHEICVRLNIGTPLSPVWEHPIEGDRNERLADLCVRNDCDTYLSGPAARAYLDESVFHARGVQVSYMEYGPYPEYPQSYPPFQHDVTVLDLLFNTGDKALNYMEKK